MTMMGERKGHRVLGVLAGADASTEWLGRWARSADRIIAADGGANLLISAGVPPHVAIGDFDSIADFDQTFERIFVDDQDSSDCDKLIRYLAESQVEGATFVGIEGDRPDHVLGSLFSLAHAPFAVRIAFRTGFGWVARPRSPLRVKTRSGALISFMPLSSCSGVHFNGVQWPLVDAVVDIGRVSLSNRAIGDFVTVSIEQGSGLLFVEQDSEPNWT